MNELKPEDVLKHEKIVVGLQSEEPAPCYRLPVKWKPEDVMMALECHSGDGDCFKVCPYFTDVYDERCIKNLMRDALAILREKDATLEMCAETIERQDKELAKKDAEIERLRAENTTYARGVEEIAVNYHKQGRAEAITEFAEELKSELIKGGIYPVFAKCAIERTEKKLKGETK